MFKRILVPLDGSEQAERAIPIAARLARASDGTIFLVRVVSTAPASLPSVPSKPILIQSVGETDRTLAESYLSGIASSPLLAGISVQTYVPVGLAAPSILSAALDKHADIIVISNHGASGVTRHWMLGSVAAKIARFSEIPVLVLHEGGPVPQERHPGEPPLCVLVPLDGSNYAAEALVPAAYLAAALAAPGQGALHLIHVVPPPHHARVLTRANRTERAAQADQNMAREYLDAMIRYLRDKSKNPNIADLNLAITASVIVDSDVAQGIVRAAENGSEGEGSGSSGRCDAIAMTTHGYSGLHNWIGSVTERVLVVSHLPMLIVRPAQ
jgi:nucleotide-binding universal stress UspA family protein